MATLLIKTSVTPLHQRMQQDMQMRGFLHEGLSYACRHPKPFTFPAVQACRRGARKLSFDTASSNGREVRETNIRCSQKQGPLCGPPVRWGVSTFALPP